MPGFVPPPSWMPKAKPSKGYDQTPDSPNFQPGKNPPRSKPSKAYGPSYGKPVRTPGESAPRPNRKAGKPSPGRSTAPKATAPKKALPPKPSLPPQQTAPKPAVHPSTGKSNATVVPNTPANPHTSTTTTTTSTAPPTPPGSYPFSSMSPAQVQAWIDAHVNAAINPTAAELKTERQRAIDEANLQAKSYAGFTNAAADLQKGVGPAIGQIYGDAASRQSTFAQGFSDAFRHIQSGEQTQANTALDNIGAPQEGRPTTTGGADALYALGGYIPASSMNREGAAFGAAASFLPATTRGQGLATLANMAHTAHLTDQGFSDQLAKLYSSMPGLRTGYQDEIDKQIQAENASKASAAQWQAEYGLKVRQIGNEEKIYGLRKQNQTFNQNATTTRLNQAGKRLDIQTQQAISSLYGVDSKGNQTLAGKKVAAMETAAQAKLKKAGQPSAATLAKANQDAFVAYHGAPRKTVSHYDSNSGKFIQVPVPGTGRPGIPYPKALARLMAVYGFTMARAAAILNTYYAPGEGGRPAAKGK